MKFSNVVFVCATLFVLLPFTMALSTSQTKIVQHTATEDPQKEGFWSHKVSWKSRWVKYWREKTIYVPVWKKVWSPLVQNEWVPLPNAPLGYTDPNEDYKLQAVEY